MARRLHRATVAVTGIGAVAAPGTASVVLPRGATIEVASVSVTDLGGTVGTDAAWSLTDADSQVLLSYALTPAAVSIAYASAEARPVPTGGACTVSVHLDVDTGGLHDAEATVTLDYSTED